MENERQADQGGVEDPAKGRINEDLLRFKSLGERGRDMFYGWSGSI